MPTSDERIAALESRLDELTTQLARFLRRDSMSQTLTCPCCGGGAILGVREINESTQGGLVPLALGRAPGFWRATPGDILQAYVCKGCRFVEWHVAGLDHLVPDGKTVIELNRPVETTPAGDAPYR